MLTPYGALFISLVKYQRDFVGYGFSKVTFVATRNSAFFGLVAAR